MNVAPLFQKNCTLAPIPPEKTVNEACVLTDVQMCLQYLTGRKMSQDDFYSLMLAKGVINADGYVNSYDRAYYYFKPMLSKTLHWRFSSDQNEAKKQIAAGNPVLIFLQGHCVLGVDWSDKQGLFVVNNPNEPNEHAPTFLTRAIRKFGWFE